MTDDTHDISGQHEPLGALAFTTSDARVGELLDRAHELSDIAALQALAGWDQDTIMPDGAVEVRGAQSATLAGIAHERWTAPRLGELVGELESVVQGQGYTDADRALVRELQREYEHATRLPERLVREIALVGAESFDAWQKARAHNDFAAFAPWLSRTIELRREVADRYGSRGTRYEALLDIYEPGMTEQQLDALFGPVRAASTALIRRIKASGATVDDSPLEGSFPHQAQLEACEAVARFMGYDYEHGYVGQSTHPFTTGMGSPFDVRMTVRVYPDRIDEGITSVTHEGGHALYEQGISPSLARTPLASGTSLGIHESQSRLWENYIGRSEAFWQVPFATLRRLFPDHFANVDVAAFARALNKVQPSLIRVDADEVTYNQHIIIRYELERQMINKGLAVESLPALWNSMYQEYLGITPPDDAHGILQDMHWSSGMGYFPTYTLGNLYAAQIYAKLRNVFPDFDDRLAGGDTIFARNWLREHMYTYGAVYRPADLIERVTGESPNPAYFARYLADKAERVYGLPANPAGA